MRGPEVFVDIPRLNDIGEDVVASGPTFTPGDDEVGLLIRVKATYIDADGVIETVFSAPTDAVVNVNDLPTGAPIISDATPTEGLALSVSTASIIDLDGIDPVDVVFTFQWQVLIGTTWTNIVGETNGLFVPQQAQVGSQLRVAVTYTDDQGTTETVFSAATGIVGDEIIAGGGANTINGTAGDDFILAGGGADTVNGLGGSDEIHGEGGTDILRGGEGNDLIFGEAGADQIFGENGNDTLDGGAAADIIDGGEGNDTITGGLGNDTLLGGNGNDVFNYTIGDGADARDGGAGTDTLRVVGTDAADTLNVVFNGTALATVAGGTITGIEAVTADLLGEADTLVYAAASAAVTVNLAANSASGFTSVRDIENVTGGNAADTLTGNGVANVLNGAGGADTLDGGAGNDTLIGGNGNDTIRGGADDDTITWAVGNGRDFVDGGAGIDTVRGRRQRPGRGVLGRDRRGLSDPHRPQPEPGRHRDRDLAWHHSRERGRRSGAHRHRRDHGQQRRRHRHVHRLGRLHRHRSGPQHDHDRGLGRQRHRGRVRPHIGSPCAVQVERRRRQVRGGDEHVGRRRAAAGYHHRRDDGGQQRRRHLHHHQWRPELHGRCELLDLPGLRRRSGSG